VGHEQNAEPRWLLPMICRAGHITKHDIGAIRIKQTETFVELMPESVDKFLKAIGPGCKVDKTVTMKRLDAAPDLGRGSGKKLFSKKKPSNVDKLARRSKFKPNNKGKKPYKSQFEKGGASGSVVPGSSPLKRKKKKLRESIKVYSHDD
jgi:ATP-dependent RNA helicase DeaD